MLFAMARKVERGAAGTTDFGRRLRGLREAAGLSQEDLAARAGLTAKGIGALERGERRHPQSHTVRSLADALGLSDAEREAFFAAVPKRAGAAPSPAEVGVDGFAAPPAAPPTPLVGREQDVAAVSSLLEGGEARLLTLTGPGGVGKTRLALEVMGGAKEMFTDSVAFVALAPLNDADLVLPTVLRTLGLSEIGGRSVRQTLREHLRGRRMLLVLDNFEHVMETAPEVANLLGACPDLVVLATSRATLRVRGKQEYPVRPLAVPDPSHPPDARNVAASPAARLFADRARKANPSFELTGKNAASVAAICWRLDGLPLALELAAAKTRFLGPTELLSRLDRALEAGGARDLPERQRTMRATLDWSYDLLRELEKELFARLSVFAGGFALEAAEAIGANGEAGGEEDDVLVLLENLVEQSLVLAELDAEGNGIRYRMLEPVRHYASEKLERGGGAEEARRRHAEYYLALAEEAGPKLKSHEQPAWLRRLETELGNLRVALSWCVEHGEGQEIARVAWASWTYWPVSGHMSEGRRWMEAALECEPQMPAAPRARLLFVAANLAAAVGDFESARLANEESMELFRRSGDEGGVHLATGTAGYIAVSLGRPEEGLPMMEEAAERRLEAGDKWIASIWFGFSAGVALGLGDRARARRLAERALPLAREIGAREAVCVALPTVAAAARADGDLELAAELCEEGLELSAEVGERVNIAYYLEGLAEISASEGRLERAARLWGAARALLETIEAIALYHAAERTFYDERMAAAREKLDRRAWEEAWAEGRAMTTEEAVGYALAKHSARPVT